jgi:hypothetical protein
MFEPLRLMTYSRSTVAQKPEDIVQGQPQAGVLHRPCQKAATNMLSRAPASYLFHSRYAPHLALVLQPLPLGSLLTQHCSILLPVQP